MSYKHERDAEKRRIKYNNLKSAVFELLGKTCVSCGFNDIRALQIDHINGGGNKHRLNSHGRTIYYLILANPDESIKKYQVLCANCNWIKRCEKNENRGRLKE